MEQGNSEIGNLIVWASQVGDKVEKLTGEACTTTKVLALHGIEKNKLIASGMDNDKANEEAKVKVANKLINGRKQK